MIKVFPSQILRESAKEVKNFGSTELKELISELFAAMSEHHGVGLAAPQLGFQQKIIVYGFDKNIRYPDQQPVPIDYAINPEIIWKSKEMEKLEEGCLSFPGLRLMVSRPKSIVFKYSDLHGYLKEKELSGFGARIVQHEIDHLNGVLFPDIAENAPNLLSMKF